MKIVNKVEFDEMIKSGYTLVDFFANWCGPCKMLGPVLEGLAEEYPNVNFVKVDVDEEGELAAKYGVMSIPTVFILKDGEIVAKTGGMQPKSQIKAFIDSAVK
jgi:thioredoxin 1